MTAQYIPSPKKMISFVWLDKKVVGIAFVIFFEFFKINWVTIRK